MLALNVAPLLQASNRSTSQWILDFLAISDFSNCGEGLELQII